MVTFPKGDRDLIKAINQNLVLNLIRHYEGVSQSTIAHLSSLSPATVSGITAELIASGLVYEVGIAESTRGRRPTLLRLNKEAGFVVGVKLMEHAVVSVLTDLDANVLSSRTTPLQQDTTAPSTNRSYTPAHVLATVGDAIDATLAQSHVERGRVCGIGVGVSGLVDSKAGVYRFSSSFPGWSDISFATPLSARFGLPVYVENDVATLTIAEQWFGSGHGLEHFAVVTVGRGIGAGIVTNGRLCRGARGGAGEIGHTTLQPDGPHCQCGKRGCLEALAADGAVVRRVQAEIDGGRYTALRAVSSLTLDTIIAAADAGDDVARQVLAESGHWLGIGVANLINTFSPQLVIISGEGVRAGTWRLDTMRAALRAFVFGGLLDDVTIIVEPLDDETWARGAACVVLGELFSSPIHKHTSDGISKTLERS